MRKPCLLTSCIMVCVLTISSCTPSNKSEKVIAFLSGNKWDGGQIYLIDIDGSRLRKLDTGLIDDGCPSWSPDGQKLLFVSANGTGGGLARELNLYTINADGSDLIQLTLGLGDVYSAAWSPDQLHIVFAAGRDRGHRPVNLYTMNTDGSNVKQITFPQPATSDRDPSWSSDGKSIVFSSNPPSIEGEENLNYLIFRFDLESNKIQDLTYEDATKVRQDLGADWSPDNNQLVFYTGNTWSGEPYRIRVLRIDSGESKEFNPPSEFVWDTSPKWSPDGKQIIFSSNRDYINTNKTYGFDIYVMDSDGSDVVRLTDSGNNICPDWQP